MTHFVAYHNADEQEELGRTERNQFYSKKKLVLDAAVGNTVWIIQGLKTRARAGKKEFTLRGKFRPDSVVPAKDDESGVFLISGISEHSFAQPPVLNDLDWFQVLYTEQNNFSFGFNRISNPDVIKALRRCVAAENNGHAKAS